MKAYFCRAEEIIGGSMTIGFCICQNTSRDSARIALGENKDIQILIQSRRKRAGGEREEGIVLSTQISHHSSGTRALLPSSSEAKGISKAGNKNQNEFREIPAPSWSAQHSSNGSPWGEERKSCRFKWVPVAQGSCPVQRGPWSLLLLPAQLGGVKSCSDFFPLTEAARVFIWEPGIRELLLIPVSLTLMQQVNI